MEKRKFPRHGLGVEAVYVFDNDSAHNCVIHEFNQDGLFLAFADDKQYADLNRRNPKQGNDVEIFVASEGRQHTIKATLVHFNESGIGVTLSGNKERSYQLLNAVHQQNNAVVDEATRKFVDGNRVFDQSRRIKILDACNAQLKVFAEETLPEYLTALENVLLNEADKQKSDAAQHPYFDAIAHFKRQAKHIPGIVLGKIISDSQDIVHGRFKPNPGISASNGDHSLALVEKGEFEEWLILRVVISRSELQLRDELIEVQLRIDAAFGKSDSVHVTNPYSPTQFAQAFHSTIHPMHLTANVERVVFKVFQDLVLNNLSRLYKSLNAIFIKQGVLPDIDVTRYLAEEALKRHRASQGAKKEQKPEPAKVDASAGTPNVKAGATTPATTPAAPTSFQSLQAGLERARHAYSAASRLMKLHRNLDTETPGQVRADVGSGEIAAPPTQETLQTINNLQQQVLKNDVSLNEPGSLAHHITQVSQQAGKVIPQQTVDSADMVENLFTNIVDHQRIAPDLKPELRKLEVPILRVLLQDPTLFSTEYHPARQFVNYVALLSDKESINLTANRPAILDSIHFVLASPVEGNEPFVQGVSKLEKVVERERKIVERNVARVTEACEGQQRIQLANNRVERELADRLVDLMVPVVLNDLISGGWKDLMRLCYLREGVESRAWEMTLVVVDQLVIRLCPNQYDEAKLLFKPEELHKLIEKGLSKVPDNKGRNTDILDRLKQHLVEQVPVNSELIKYQPSERRSTAPGLETIHADPDDKLLQRWISRARKLKEGQWLEFDAKSSNSHLYQIAWIAEQQARFVFVNHHGFKVADFSLGEVAEKLKNGDLVVLSDSVLPAVENGLDSLVQKIYDQLALESSQDQVTGLKTRKEFEHSLAQAVSAAKTTKQKYALFYFDVVQFKVINNTCGYEAGDALLREIGGRLRNMTANDMVAGRVGSNEFGVIASVDSEQNAFHLATSIKSVIEEKRFISGNQSFVVESVASLVLFDDHNEQILELLRSAESAVAIAKKSGHKEIQVVKPGDSRIEERDEVMAWVARINRALDFNTLKLRVQKIAPVDEKASALPHYEILLTVVDENGIQLPPADFIRAAEEYSRMSSVDRWVIEYVLRWMIENRNVLDRIGGFSINLSGHTMNDDSFLDFMFESLVRYAVPRDKLIFEVTETTAVANLDDAADFINEMRGIGCRFSLDDFGAGQSSYAYLKRLPVDFIKIDGAFIKNIAADDVDYALVKSITEMGHFLNKKIIAEYVSDKDIMEVVKDIGVDYVQGFYLGKPQFIEDLVH